MSLPVEADRARRSGRAAAGSAARSSTCRSRTRRRCRASRRGGPSSEMSSTACTAALPRANTPCFTAKCFVRCSSSTRVRRCGAHAASPRRAIERSRASLDACCSHGRWQASRMRLGDRRDERRALDRARLEAVAAARVERAARRAGEQRRRRAFDRHERVEPPLDRRHRVEQAPGVRVLRLLEDLAAQARTP